MSSVLWKKCVTMRKTKRVNVSGERVVDRLVIVGLGSLFILFLLHGLNLDRATVHPDQLEYVKKC